MNLKIILGFLVGRADAIRDVASSKAAFWTGMALVVLTAFPRNYDQTYIPEKPLLWFLGPLLFSIVSGTWLFLISYGFCARRTMADADGNKPPLWSSWRGFMGAFWMTAPIAWIYAIPVERFWDSLTATKANLWLLAIVSLWRVLLMARVFQVVCRAPAWLSLLWVLLPAAIEVLGIVFFSESFGRRLMASMGGMRNSPEEDLIYAALGTAFMAAFWSIPVLLLLWGIWNRYGDAVEWPIRKASTFPWKLVAVLSVFWIGVAIQPQLELRRNWTLEQHIERREMRAALDYMNQYEPNDFPPARGLPPKLYEWDTFEKVLPLAGAATAADKPWVRRHVTDGLSVAAGNMALWWKGTPALQTVEPNRFRNGINRWNVSAADLLPLFTATNRAPEVEEWLQRHTNFIQGIVLATSEPTISARKENYSEEQQRADWSRLGEVLRQLGYAATNSQAGPVQ